MNRVLLFVAAMLSVNVGYGICVTNMINPISDIEWDCMFPMTIGGLVSIGGEEELAPSGQSGSFCNCFEDGSNSVGIPFGFWEPKAFIDVVQDAWCFPAMGFELEGMEGAYMNDGSRASADRSYTFAQSHFTLFPALAILDMYYDIPCLKYGDSEGEMDIALVTELLPTWNNDVLAATVYPETVLYANPAAQLACIADAIPSNGFSPINELYWCMGAWGTTYPMTGTISGSDQMEAQAAIAGRSIFQMGRMGLLKEYDKNGCYQRYVSIWTKNRYKLQLMRPTKSSQCINFGRSALIWATGLNTLDNHSYFMFRKVDCCGY